MTLEANPEEVEDFPLQPISAGPDGDERIHNRVAGGEAHLQTQAGAPGNRNKLIGGLKARLERIAVEAGGVAQQIKLEFLVSATALGNVAQYVARNDDGSLAAKLDHFTDRVGIPSTQSLDHNISNLVAVVRHSSRILQLRRLFMPVERALFPEINVPNQEDGNVHEHLCEAIAPHLYRMPDHVPINVSPGIQEDRFYVKQDKDHGYEVKLHGERLACVARGFHPALVSLLFSAIW